VEQAIERLFDQSEARCVFFGVDPATGQRFVTQSIEGGGWGGRPYEDGEPAERDPALVARDVVEEYVSIDAARDQYGVVFQQGTFTVDRGATAWRRADLASRPEKTGP
jgi:N-methylhydantoinase B/oxoprolinase/acetone carboxylase alpha subunit